MIARIFIILLALTLPAQARDLSGAEKKALEELVGRYEAAVVEKDYWALGAAVPPLVLKRYVDARGDPELKRDLWVGLFVSDSKQIDRQMGNVTEGFTLGLSKAEFKQTPDGTPYVLLPSTSTVKLRSGDRLKIFAPYLALLDEGKWYLLNVGFGGLMGSVKGLYPSFDEIEFDFATQKKL